MNTRQTSAENSLDVFRKEPYSLEAEQAVLGALLLENDRLEDVGDILQADDFHAGAHRLIFAAIFQIFSQGQPFDVVTLADYLQNNAQLEDIGGIDYLASLADSYASTANVLLYAQIVREKSILRKLIKVAREMIEKAYQPSGDSLENILNEIEQKIFNLSREGQSEKVTFRNMRQLIGQVTEEVEARFSADSHITGVETHFLDLDEKTAGLQRGDLIIVAGRPSMGKTSFAMNMAENIGVRGNQAVAIFSLEMPAEQLVMRLISSLGRLNASKLRTGKLDGDDWSKFVAAAGRLSQTKIFVDDTPAITPMEMRSRIRRMIKENNNQPLSLVVVDYLQLMRSSNVAENRVNEISDISRSLKALAKEFKVPLIALSQLNRSLEQRPDKRPKMSDLRESGAIEQDADVILFIYRDEVYNEDSSDKGTAEIIIGKQRNGAIGKVRMAFLGEFTRFENLAAHLNRGFDDDE